MFKILHPEGYESTRNNTPGQSSVSPSVPQLTSETDLWLTQDVMKYFHLSAKTVFNLRKNGLPYLQIGGAIRFVPEEIKEYLVKNRGLRAHRSRQIARERGTK